MDKVQFSLTTQTCLIFDPESSLLWSVSDCRATGHFTIVTFHPKQHLNTLNTHTAYLSVQIVFVSPLPSLMHIFIWGDKTSDLVKPPSPQSQRLMRAHCWISVRRSRFRGPSPFSLLTEGHDSSETHVIEPCAGWSSSSRHRRWIILVQTGCWMGRYEFSYRWFGWCDDKKLLCCH